MEKMKPVMFAALLFLFGCTGANGVLANNGQAKPGAAQESWEGTVDYTAYKLRLVLNIARAGSGGLKASLLSIDQGNLEIPINSITYKDSFVHFEIEAIDAVFEGGISRDGTELAGQWRQGGARPLTFKRKGLNAGPAAVNPSDFKRGRMQFEPCNLPNLSKDAMCGKYEVFEDRAARTGRKIALNLILLPALAARPAADPVFYFEGGPGGSAAAKVKKGGDFVTKLRRERDVVFIDQRGTGESNPLSCNFYGDGSTMSGYFTESVTGDKARGCREQLEKRANLALYTSSYAADDFDEVRAALGYERINVFGGSYGSTMSMLFMRQHPDRVRAALIEGVAPPNYKIPLPFAKGVQQALNRLFSDCAADGECGQVFPGLRDEFNGILARLDKEPVTFQAVHPFTRKPEQITMTRKALMDHVRMMLYAPDTARLLPILIHQMAQGNFSTFASISFQLFKGVEDAISRGLHLSVGCAEGVQFLTEDEIKRETAGTYYGDNRVREFIAACQQWPKGKLPEGFNQPVKSTLPTLLISGALDPVTPPELAADAARHLPNSLHVIVRNTGHSFSSECLDNLRAEFISKGSTKGLNPACANDIKRPPFVLKLQ